MMHDIEAGKINCVIVKDLSRLGRDYIEAGRFIQKIFPAFSVRFIAVADYFDSLTANYYEASLVVPIKNFVNDSYARDISNKVRSHQKVKREKGEFIGAFSIYGYKKSEKNRNLLIPDAYAANIVQKIFLWKIEGYSNLEIAKLLEQFGVLSPMEYKKIRGEKFQTGFFTKVKTKWSAVAVKRILTNENYTGTLVQGKEEKISYKIKKSIKKPEKEWIKAEKAHRAIISKEDFEMVQNFLKIDMRAKIGTKKTHIYAGLLFCGNCGKPMIRRVNHYQGKEAVSFICSTKNKGEKCTRHTILEKHLEEIILRSLKQQIVLVLNQKQFTIFMEKREKNTENRKEDMLLEEEIERLSKEKEKYSYLKEALYQDLKKQIITEEDFYNFQQIFKEYCQELEKTIQNQQEARKIFSKARKKAENNLRQLKETMQIAKLDRITLVSFVKRIFVYEEKRIDLEFRYKEEWFHTIINSKEIETKLFEKRGN